MQPIDPKTSPEALAIAGCALVIALFDQLTTGKPLDRGDIHNVIRTSMISVGARAASPEGAEAAKMLQSLLLNFPQG